MNSGGEDVVFHDGELWWFNNKAVHDAFNPSDHGRIHVIFDVLSSRPAAEFWPHPDAVRDGFSTLAPPVQAVQATTTEAINEAAGIELRSHVDVPGTLPAAVRAIFAGRTPAATPAALLGSGTGVVQLELRLSGHLVAICLVERLGLPGEGISQALASIRARNRMRPWPTS